MNPKDLAKELLEHVLRVHPNDAALVNRAEALVTALEENDNVDSASDRRAVRTRKGQATGGE